MYWVRRWGAYFGSSRARMNNLHVIHGALRAVIDVWFVSSVPRLRHETANTRTYDIADRLSLRRAGHVLSDGREDSGEVVVDRYRDRTEQCSTGSNPIRDRGETIAPGD